MLVAPWISQAWLLLELETTTRYRRPFLILFFHRFSCPSFTTSTPSTPNLSPLTTLVTLGSGRTPRGLVVEWSVYQRDTWG